VSVLNRLFTEALSRGAFVESGMRSPEIVMVEVSRETVGSVDGGWVGPFVSPLAKQGLDEAFGLSIGLRVVGLCPQVTELEPLADSIELGLVAGSVVGHYRLDGYAAVLEPGDRASEKASRARGSFIRQDLGVSHARSVVDGDMDELPADASNTGGAVTVDAMSNTSDTTQLLDVDVDQFAGPISLVSDDRLLGLEALEPRQAMASQDPGHGRRAQPHARCDLRARIPSLAQTQHVLNPVRVGLPRHPMRAGTAVDQGRLAGLGKSPLPLEGRPPGYTGRRGGPGHGHPSDDPLNEQGSTGWATSGIVVKLHLGSFGWPLALNTSSLTDPGPDGQLQTRTVNNVLRNDT
jgi:hypothetical protein